MRLVAIILLLTLATSVARAGETLADQLYYFEPGNGAASGFTDPENALRPSLGSADRSGILSLGAYSGPDATRQPGIILGWRFPLPNNDGADIRIRGNNFGGFHEPGMIEVAAETTGAPGSWEDETFYLIRPSNYDALPADPRTAPAPITLATNGRSLYSEPHWQLPLTGYADVSPDGDLIDISDAIDLQGNPISLDSIAYVRIRTITDSTAGTLGQISTEIDTVTALHDLLSPLPTPDVVAGWTISPIQAAPPGWVIEALAIDPNDSSLLTTERDYCTESATRILRNGEELRRIEPAVFAAFITPTKFAYTNSTGSGGIERLQGGGFTKIPQLFDIIEFAGFDIYSRNPILFESGAPMNQISTTLESDNPETPTLLISTGGFSGPIAFVEETAHLWYAEPNTGNTYRFPQDEPFTSLIVSLSGSNNTALPLTLADADLTLPRQLNALANGSGSNLIGHDFSTLISIDTESKNLAINEIATSSLSLGAIEMWAGEIYLVATDYTINQSVVFRLTPETGAPTITPLANGALATFLPGTPATIETLTKEGTWKTATSTTGASREGNTLTATSHAPTGIFRLRTRR